jgi:hypothetical protein
MVLGKEEGAWAEADHGRGRWQWGGCWGVDGVDVACLLCFFGRRRWMQGPMAVAGVSGNPALR